MDTDESIIKCHNLFVFWDLESTSKDPTEDAIISIGGVIAEYRDHSFQKLSEFHTYVSTTREIDPVAQSIHNISKADLKGAPNFCDAIGMFKLWIQEICRQCISPRVILMAHNGSRFDDLMLFCNCVSNYQNFDDFLTEIHCHGFIDTLKLLRNLFKTKHKDLKPKCPDTSKVSFTLGNCYVSFCGKTLEGAHDALADSQALFEVFTAPCIRPMFTVISLCKYLVRKEKAVKTIKACAGMSIHRKEEATRQQRLDDELIDEGGMPDIPGIIHPADPIWEKRGCTTNQALCLGCMRFFNTKEHLECTRPVSALLC